jgi:hypothetical protein
MLERRHEARVFDDLGMANAKKATVSEGQRVAANTKCREEE